MSPVRYELVAGAAHITLGVPVPDRSNPLDPVMAMACSPGRAPPRVATKRLLRGVAVPWAEGALRMAP